MANPLFNRLFGGVQQQMPVSQSGQPETGVTAGNAPRITMEDALRQLRSDPAGMIKQAGFNVPEEYANDPRSTVMHLIQSGQVGGSMMRMIAPMLNRMGVR